MKSVKKLFFIFCMVLISVMYFNVNAASVPYNWIVGGETVNESNANKTATLTKNGTEVLLKLSNYKGGELKLNCYGTGQDGITFIIDLDGDNVITSDGVGIDFNYNGKIKFNGNGKLTINAKTPISYESYKDKMIIEPSKNVYTDKEETTESDNKLISEKDDKLIQTNCKEALVETKCKQTKDNSCIIYIILGSCLLVSLIVNVILATKLCKKKEIQ